LSGCFEPTPAKGLTDFLFVQAAVSPNNVPSRTIQQIRRDINPRKILLWDSRPGRPAEQSSAVLDFL
jgi:hypothetical protein